MQQRKETYFQHKKRNLVFQAVMYCSVYYINHYNIKPVHMFCRFFRDYWDKGVIYYVTMAMIYFHVRRYLVFTLKHVWHFHWCLQYVINQFMHNYLHALLLACIIIGMHNYWHAAFMRFLCWNNVSGLTEYIRKATDDVSKLDESKMTHLNGWDMNPC